MIKLKSLLMESREQFLSSTKVREYLYDQCSLAVKKYKEGVILYRGEDFHKSTSYAGVIVDPSTSRRTSVDTSNAYMLYMDSSPYWKGYPSRSLSLICGNWETAASYGDRHIVFPIGNPKVAIAVGSNDFLGKRINNDSDVAFSGTVNWFDGFLSKYFNCHQLHGSSDIALFKRTIDKAIMDYRSSNDWEDGEDISGRNAAYVLIEIIHNASTKKDAIKIFYNMFTPKDSNTDCKSFSELTSEDANCECWTEGKCLLVPENTIKSILGV